MVVHETKMAFFLMRNFPTEKKDDENFPPNGCEDLCKDIDWFTTQKGTNNKNDAKKGLWILNKVGKPLIANE